MLLICMLLFSLSVHHTELRLLNIQYLSDLLTGSQATHPTSMQVDSRSIKKLSSQAIRAQLKTPGGLYWAIWATRSGSWASIRKILGLWLKWANQPSTISYLVEPFVTVQTTRIDRI
jgi:hypothetical protein